MKKALEYLKNVFIGVIVGIANIIPGVSGGTMAVVTGVYDRLISSVSHFFKNIKDNIIFLSAIIIGAICGILLLSNGINFLLDGYYAATNVFFIGVIVGSIPMVYKKASENGYKIYHMIPGVVTFTIMILLIILTPPAESTIIRSMDIGTFFMLLGSAALSAFCMIIPGISGSFVMVLIGVYETITVAISEFNIAILIPVGIGIIIGLLLGIKIIDKVIKRFPQMTYFAILGFMIGSVPSLIQKILNNGGFGDVFNIVISCVVGVIGFVIAYLFCSGFFEKKFDRKIEE